MTPPVPVDLRQPTLSLVLLATSYVVAAGLVLFVLTTRAGALTTALFLVVVAAITVANTVRALSRARTTPEGALAVRNWFRTTTVRPADVDRVMVTRAGGPGSLRRVELLRVDGSTLQVVATETLLPAGGRARLEAQADQLRAWAATG